MLDKLVNDISCALRSGEFARSVVLCESARRYAPDDVRVVLLSATCELAVGNSAEAAVQFRRFLNRDSQSILARQGLIDSLLQLGRPIEVFDDIADWVDFIAQNPAIKSRFQAALNALPYQIPVVAYSREPHIIGGWIYIRDPLITAVDLDMALDNGPPEKITLDQLVPGLNAWRLPVSLNDGCIQITSVDGVILGNPVFLKPDVKRLPPPPPTRRIGLARLTRTVDVVVPVYKDRQATLECLESVLAARVKIPFELVVIDDVSPDACLTEDLESLAKQKKITLLQHQKNVGFVCSVNEGMSLHLDRDVVLLNSDTLVYDGWLDGLVETANSATRVGTVTAFSNNATICSYPQTQSTNGEICLNEHKKIARSALQLPIESIEIPTGVGSCMWISRLCLMEVGFFDAEVFGKGYAEENDFCCRAVNAGWKNVAAPNVYVTHHGDRSFGQEKLARIKVNLEKLNARHPGYDAHIQAFLMADPLRKVRRKLDITRLKDYEGAILCITHFLGGGIERFLQERSIRLQHGGSPVFYLKASISKGYVLEAASQPSLFPNLCFTTEETALLTETLDQLRPSLLEYHSLVDAPWELTQLPQKIHVPYSVYLHDYSWACHQVTLLQDGDVFCGGPHDTSTCERCRTFYNSRMVAPGISTQDWRTEAAAFLRGAREVIAPTRSTSKITKKAFRNLPITVVPHEEVLPLPKHIAHSNDGKSVRVAVIGAIGDHKGYAMLCRLAKYASIWQLPVEFVVIGYTKDDQSLHVIGNTHITGPYKEMELPELCRKWRVAVALFLSPWPETWSYTLSEAFQCGLPVLAPKLGAFEERIREDSCLFKPNARVEELARQLLKLTLNTSTSVNKEADENKVQRRIARKGILKQPDIQSPVEQPC